MEMTIERCMSGSGRVPMAATAAGEKVENERAWP